MVTNKEQHSFYFCVNTRKISQNNRSQPSENVVTTNYILKIVNIVKLRASSLTSKKKKKKWICDAIANSPTFSDPIFNKSSWKLG